MALSIGDLCDAIEATLATATGLASSTSFDELAEGIAVFDCPRLEVHPGGGSCDPSGNTDRSTFGAGMQMSVVEIYADIYAAHRSHLNDDMKATIDMIDALSDVLQAAGQERPPFFAGAEGLKACSWSWKRRTWRRSKAWYMGARFTIICKIF